MLPSEIAPRKESIFLPWGRGGSISFGPEIDPLVGIRAFNIPPRVSLGSYSATIQRQSRNAILTIWVAQCLNKEGLRRWGRNRTRLVATLLFGHDEPGAPSLNVIGSRRTNNEWWQLDRTHPSVSPARL